LRDSPRLNLSAVTLAGWLALAAMAGRAGHAQASAGRVEAESGLTTASFASLVTRLSEAGGYFDTDNLISNESSYLHAVTALNRLGVTGGAYLGVGPDQNFSYIARIRPSIAFIIDIRRDNLLELLMFKACFALAPSRIEYLSLLLGRPAPADPSAWTSRPLAELTGYLDRTPATPASREAARAAMLARARTFGVALTPADLATIIRFHDAFVTQGLDLRFTTFQRAPRPDYPDYRRLLLETDREGRQASYLASEADYRFVKSLQDRNLVIPVVGDLAGDHAMAAIARTLTQRNQRVSAIYASNVEFYLMQNGSFDRFVRNVGRLPRAHRSAIIRSYFPYRNPHPHAVPGYNSTQVVQPIASLIRGQHLGAYRTYFDLVTRDAVDGQP